MDINLKEILVAGVNANGYVVEKPLPPASEEQVVNFEKKIDSLLPADYRNFLLTINGGQPNLNKMEGVEYKVTPVTGDPRALSGTNLLDFLYSLGDVHSEVLGTSVFPIPTLDSSYTFLSDLKSGDYPFVPANCIPIGTPPGNQSKLLLCLAGEFVNHILDYEYGRDPQEQNGNISIAGTSFTEFVNGWRIMNFWYCVDRLKPQYVVFHQL